MDTSANETTKRKTLANVMKGIRPFRDGYRVELMRNGVRKSVFAPTIEQALIARERLDKELQGSEAGETLQTASQEQEAPQVGCVQINPVQTWTLEEAVDMTFVQCWQNIADKEGQRMKAKQLLDYFGPETPITAITTEWVLRFRQWCGKEYGNKYSTINRKVCCLSKILHTAVEHDRLPRVPKMPLQRENDNARLRFMTLEEEKETLVCFETYTTQDHADAFIALLDTGFRTGELWTIRRGQVNFTTKTIFLKDGETKNNSGRTVYMTARVEKILQRRLENEKGEFVFPYKNSWFSTGWKKVRKLLGKSGEADWVPHMLRHTCCSRLVQAGVDLFLVQRWMGHKDLSVTQRYAHHAPDALRKAGEKMEKLTKGLL